MLKNKLTALSLLPRIQEFVTGAVVENGGILRGKKCMCPLNVKIHLSSTCMHQAIPEKSDTGKDEIYPYQPRFQLSSCSDGKN